MPHRHHTFLFPPLIFPQTSIVGRTASDPPEISTDVHQVRTFGSTYKPVIYIDCQFYGRVLRYASRLIYYFHLKLIHYSTA
jgi:hypothetical protein